MREAQHNPHLGRGSTFGRLAIVMLAGLFVTGVVFWQTRKLALAGLRSRFESDAAADTALIRQEADKSLLAIKSVSWFLQGTGSMDGKSFQAFAAACLPERKELQALSWNPRVLAAERAGFEQRARREGMDRFHITERDPDGRLIAARERETYYPVLYMEPPRGNEAAVGFDVGSEAVRLAALERARDTGEPAVTEPIRLVQQEGGEGGFLIFVPVYRQGMPQATVEERRAALEGFVVGVYHAGTVVAAALRGMEPMGLSLAFLDRSAPVERQLMCCWDDTLKGDGSWKSMLFPAPPRAMDTFAFAGRQWSVETMAGQAYMERRCPISHWLILPAGLLLGFLGARHEVITQRKQAEEAIRESEARYRAVVENSPDGMAVSVENKVVYVNSAAVRLAGAREAGDLLGRSILEFVQEDYRAETEKRRAKMLETGLPSPVIDVKLRRPDGRIVDAESMGVPIVYGGKPAILNSFRDITEQHRAAEALRQSEARYRTLFESAQDAILLNEGERLADCNPVTLRMFGCRREEIIGQTPIRLSPPFQPDGRDSAQKGREKIDAAYAGVPQFFEWRHRRFDGGEFDAEVSLNRIEVAEQPMLLAIVRDITARKQIEEALHRAHDEMEQRVRERTAELVEANQRLEELDRLKSQFLATMSHELRTPLNSIIGFAGILRQGFAGPVNEEQKKQLNLVFGSAKHLLSLINDLLDLSRIEAGKVELEREPFDFVDVVEEVVQSLTPIATQKNLRLATDLPGPVIEMAGDRKRCFQVLLNLANNAVKFTDHGEVTITARTEPDTLRVCVADTGIGIKPEQMGMLFEAFRQLDGTARRMYEGTGLGLHLCRRLATLMGGEVGVESEFGKGSRFTFTLPRRVGGQPESQRDEYENLSRG